MENILEVENLCKGFSNGDFALDKVSFSIPYGSIMGFVGENGAGKTTTISCILNTMFKDSGTIKLFGKALSDDDTELREKIGEYMTVIIFRHTGRQSSCLMLCKDYIKNGMIPFFKSI